MKKLLEVRKLIKGKKPTFTRQENTKKRKISDVWRKPRGMHSKMRLHVRGKKRSPETGWGSPRAVSGLHASGLKPVLVHTPSQVEKIAKTEGIIIAKTVGMRKKAEIVALAKAKSVAILNIKDAEGYLASVKSELANRKTSQKAREEAKKKALEAKSESKDSKKTEEKTTEKAAGATPAGDTDSKESDDHKKKEKQEQDKVLTKRS